MDAWYYFEISLYPLEAWHLGWFSWQLTDFGDFRFPLPGLHVRYQCFPPAASDSHSRGREGNISCTRRLSRASDLFGGNTPYVQLSLSYHFLPNCLTLNLSGLWRRPFTIEG